MTTRSQRPKGWDGALSSLDVAIDALNLAKEPTGTSPAKAAFESTSDLLTIIRVSFLASTSAGYWLMYIGLDDP